MGLELPAGGALECISTAEIVYWAHTAMSAAEMAFAEQGRVVSAYTFAEKASIQKVIAYIDHTIFCCVKSNSQVYTMTGTTSGVVNIQAQMEPIIGGETIDVTSDVAGFLNKMAAKMQGIEGSIYFYDQLSPWCENVMDAIAGEAIFIPAIHEDDNVQQQQRSAVSDFLAFHATGHSAQIVSSHRIVESPFYNYMSEGCCLKAKLGTLLLSYQCPCRNHEPGLSSLEELVSEITHDYSYPIKERIYIRFIKL